MNTPLIDVDLPGLKLIERGKVRNIYDFEGDVLVVATDRLSAFDRPMGAAMEGKGRVLTAMTAYWFEELADVRANYMVSCGVPEALGEYGELLSGRTMLTRRVSFLPIEFVVRGYLYGSAWREYQEKGEFCGFRPGPGMALGERLPEPLFTPALKVKNGHDVNISEDEYYGIVGEERGRRLKETGIEIFRRASSSLGQKGILLADTKMEFGLRGDGEVIVNELLTPDSSRFWLKEKYAPGRPQESMDKQPLRDYLQSVGWTGEGTVPDIPSEVLIDMGKRYRKISRMVTGRDV